MHIPTITAMMFLAYVSCLAVL